MANGKGKKRISPSDPDSGPAEGLDTSPTLVKDEDVDVEAPPAKRGKKAKGKPRRSGADQEYENGVLRAVVLENFMNHEHLRVDFDPHVNFIVGKNGSGKSAIVNALIAGFGHKANATGKNTNSAKSLIMNTKSYALIQIHLANGGEDAYKPEEFGDTIVAEHRIERAGAGSYVLRDGADGKPRKSSKSEFTDLCQHMNIQADNPCVLLTQDHAKKFLHDGSEESRYQFFLQAANLAQRQADLMSTNQNLNLLEDKLNKAKDGLLEKQEFSKQCQIEYEGAQKLRERAKELENFEPMLGWALVTECEIKLGRAKEMAAAAAEKEREAERNTVEADNVRKELEEQLATREREASQAEKRAEEISKRAEKSVKEAKEVQKNLKKYKREVENFENELAEAKASAEQAGAEYENAMNALEGSAQEEQVKKVTKLKEELSEYDKSINGLTETLREREQTYKMLIEERRRLVEDSQAKDQESKEQKAALEELERGTFDRHSVLHPQLPQLLEVLERSSSKFREPPIGPIGLHVNIREGYEHLSPAMEHAIGTRGLLTFLVTNGKDEEVLRAMMKRLNPPKGRMPPLNQRAQIVIKRNSRRYELATRSASSSTTTIPPTLLDAVEISSSIPQLVQDAVFNFLCDSSNGERTMLFNVRHEAEQAVSSSDDSNARGIFCNGFNGSTGASEPRLIFKRQGRTFGNEYMVHQRGLLKIDKSSAIAQQKQAAKTALSLAKALKDELAAKDAERKRAENAVADTKKRLKTMCAQKDQATILYDELQTESAADTAQMQVQSLHNEWEMAKQRIDTFEKELEKARVRVGEAQETFQPMKEKIADLQQKYDELFGKATQLNEEANAAKVPLLKRRASMGKMRQSHTEAAKARTTAEKEVAELQAYLDKIIPQVKDAYGERVHDPKQRSVDELKKYKMKLERDLKKAEDQHGGKSIEELATLASNAVKAFQEGEANIKAVEATNKAQREAMVQRYKFYKKEVKQKARQATNDFNQRLSRKNHAGALEFDFDRETLSLSISRNAQDTSAKSTQDARNLSGGERSFTTLSFELAMWEFCQTPFRVLDEFDVFMDDTYRRQAVLTLLELCDAQPTRQFLFVTPQDMHPFLAGRTDTNIIKMKDVRKQRGSTA